eukprot:GHVU01041369.1.p1 GENE.GHVU01041369.1~~GHVU01041369.1.p1  ORF type:complete len:166 (+),score=15.99 GHVU01041369.1:789-1286(+)
MLFQVCVCLAREGLDAVANWLRKEYLSPPWNTWFAAASGTPGVKASINPQEFSHNVLKNGQLKALRCSTEVLLNDSFPALLMADSERRGAYLSIRVAPEQLAVAVHVRTAREMVDATAYYRDGSATVLYCYDLSGTEGKRVSFPVCPERLVLSPGAFDAATLLLL